MQNHSFNLQSTVHLLQTKWKQLLFFVLVSLLVASITLFIVPKQYYAASTVVSANPSLADKAHLLNQNIQNLYSVFGSGDDLERIYGIASMDTVYKQLVDEFNLISYYQLTGADTNRVPLNFNLLRRKAVLELKEDINIQKTEFAQLKISIWTKDAALSAKIVNRMVEITRLKEESIWKSGYEKMLVNFNRSIDSLTKIYDVMSTTIKMEKENASQIYYVKSNSLYEQINAQQKAASELKLAIDNNAPSLFVLETAVAAAKPEKPNIPEVLILTAIVSLVFAVLVLLIYHREDSL
jgi:capsular polysaccharide biosynthesis protein